MSDHTWDRIERREDRGDRVSALRNSDAHRAANDRRVARQLERDFGATGVPECLSFLKNANSAGKKDVEAQMAWVRASTALIQHHSPHMVRGCARLGCITVGWRDYPFLYAGVLMQTPNDTSLIAC